MATATETSDPPGGSSSPTPSASRNGLGSGAIAGIVVGTVFAISILICFVFFILRRRKSRHTQLVAATAAAHDNRAAFYNHPATAYTQPATTYSHPTTGKVIPELSPKQVLGLDDASYLGRLPTQYGHPPNLAVHPAYVPPQFDRLPSTQYRSPLQVPAYVAGGGVNPWDLEYGPNSVIFPHLAQQQPAQPLPVELQGESTRSLNSDQDRISSPVENPAKSPKRPSRFEALSSTLKRIKQSRRDHKAASPEVELEMTEISSSDETARSSSSTAADDSSRTLSPATTSSTLSSVAKGKEPVKDLDLVPIEAVECTTYAVAIPERPDEDTAMDIDPVPAAAAMTLVPQAMSPTGSSPAADFPCSKCNERFRLPGLLRNHDNRKHNLRYVCRVCDAAFGLRADLERHKATRHSKELGEKPDKVFKCPNTGCLTPEKEYFRKDNFMRHTRRCKKARIKDEEKSKDGKEAG